MKSIFFAAPLLLISVTGSALAWNNGQSGNPGTNTKAECSSPPYATHDWIADHALDLLPADEKAWLLPHRALYLIGTEAPDNRTIRIACGTPHAGYDDKSKGHSVEWNMSVTQMINDRPAVRAQQEYDKAVIAFRQGKPGHAAFFLGAMAHYIGDVSQYGHNYPDEIVHGAYEGWAAGLTPAFNGGTFEAAISLDSLVRRTPYTATRACLPRGVCRGRRHSVGEANGQPIQHEAASVHDERRRITESGSERTRRCASHVFLERRQ